MGGGTALFRACICRWEEITGEIITDVIWDRK